MNYSCGKLIENQYSHLGKAEALISLAGAHHRFPGIHAFIEGNGPAKLDGPSYMPHCKLTKRPERLQR
jgi:hypothetical protein